MNGVYPVGHHLFVTKGDADPCVKRRGSACCLPRNWRVAQYQWLSATWAPTAARGAPIGRLHAVLGGNW